MASVKDYFADVLAEEPLLAEPPMAANTAQGNLATLLDENNPNALAVLDLVESVEHYAYLSFGPDVVDRLPAFGLEGIGQGGAGLIGQMVEWLRKLIAILFDEMRNLELAAYTLHLQAENLKIQSRDRRKSYGLTGGQFKVNTRTANLCVRYRPISQVNDLIAHLRTLDQVTRAYFAWTPFKELSRVVRAVSGTLDLNALQDTLAGCSPEQLANKGGFNAHPDNSAWRASLHLMGGQRLVVKRRDDGSPMDALAALKVRMIPSELTPPLPPVEINFVNFNMQSSDQCLNLISSIAQNLVKVNSGAARAARKGGLGELSKLLERLQHQAAASGGASASDVRNAALCIEYYVDWIVKPYSELYGLTCRNLRAALNVCDLNAQ